MFFLFEPTRTLIVVLLASVTALAAAFVSEYVFDLPPCVLCIYQRWPYGLVIVVAITALVLKGRFTRPALLICGLALLVDAGIAGFHVGVEQRWWEGTTSCSGAVATAQSVEELRKQLMAAPIVRCEDPAFVLFGISMAGYNFLYALALAALALLGAKGLPRQEPQP